MAKFRKGVQWSVAHEIALDLLKVELMNEYLDPSEWICCFTSSEVREFIRFVYLSESKRIPITEY